MHRPQFTGGFQRFADEATSTLRVLSDRLLQIETKLDVMIGLGGLPVIAPTKAGAQYLDAAARLRAFTIRQHAAMQMSLAGHVDREIAERLGVSRSTAKQHRRYVQNKLGVGNSYEAKRRFSELIDAVDDVTYQQCSGGLPKTWARRWQSPDPYASLYRD